MNNAAERLILMVEDSEEDFVATKRAFKKSGYNFLRLERAESASEATDFLFRRGNWQNKPSAKSEPALILLDLNLPGVDGREFLLSLKRDERLKEIPVVILTTSDNPRDVNYCYKNGANGYQVKSVGFDKYLETIKTMIHYWFETATIPAAVK